MAANQQKRVKPFALYGFLLLMAMPGLLLGVAHIAGGVGEPVLLAALALLTGRARHLVRR